MFKLDGLTKEEINYVGQVLSERPFREVAGLMKKLDEQIKAQLEEKQNKDK